MTSSKHQTLQQLNRRLKNLTEEKTTLSHIGKVVVGGGIYNAQKINEQIPRQAEGKIGSTFFDNEEIKPSNESMHSALFNIKKKQRHQQLREQGYFVNEKTKNNRFDDQEHADLFSGLQYELYDNPNPHYKKMFDADYFYKVNESESEDEFTKKQREEVEEEYETKQISRRKKKELLERAMKSQKETLKREKMEQSQMQEDMEREQNLKRVLEGDSPKQTKKGILKKLNTQFGKTKKSIAFQDENSMNQSQFNDNGSQYSKSFQETENIINYTQQKDKQDLEEIQQENIPKWKLASKSLRAALKGNKDRSFKENEIINEAMHNKELEQCPHCKRKFHKIAIEKHIPSCYDRQLNLKMKTPRRVKKAI